MHLLITYFDINDSWCFLLHNLSFNWMSQEKSIFKRIKVNVARCHSQKGTFLIILIWRYKTRCCDTWAKAILFFYLKSSYSNWNNLMQIPLLYCILWIDRKKCTFGLNLAWPETKLNYFTGMSIRNFSFPLASWTSSSIWLNLIYFY